MPRKRKTDRIVGQRFGKLVVLKRLQDLKQGAQNARQRVLVQCDCGNRVVIRRNYLLRKPNPKISCGYCGRVPPTVPESLHPEYAVWKAMIARCNDPKHVSYEKYGGSGVQVCDRWMESFQNFIADMGWRPSKSHSIDRIDPNRNYEPDNVKWATGTEQARNKKNTKYVVHPKTKERVKAADLMDEYNTSMQQLRTWMIKEGLWYDPMEADNDPEQRSESTAARL